MRLSNQTEGDQVDDATRERAPEAAGKSPLDSISYDDLYARWERGNWSATQIDLSVDREQWQSELNEEQRRAALWNYSLFFHGEQVVAETLGPYIDAAPRPEHKHFLATQQADEARHSVFFSRFLSEVAGQGDDVSSALQATDPHLTWGFRHLFGHLQKLSGELARDPSVPKLAEGVALYHVLIEGALAQSGQRFIEDSLEKSGLLPGLLEGIKMVSRDEERHIAFGVKLLAELVASDPEAHEGVARLMRRAIPWSLTVFVPPGWDPSYTEAFGYTLEDIYAESQRSFEQKLRLVGAPPESLHGATPFRPDMTPRERADRVLLIVRGGMLGERNGPASRDPRAVEALFDTISLAIDHRHAPSHQVTVQWDFTDLEPWHLIVDNGNSRAVQGPAAAPDLVLRSGFDDWVDVFARRETARSAILKRKLRPKGSPLLLRRFEKMLAG